MSNEIDYYKVKAISNSSLNLLETSPRKFIKFFNQELEEDKENYFKQGSAIHCYILEPEEFKQRFKFMEYSSPNSPNKKQFVETYLKTKGKEDDRVLKAYKASYTTSSDEQALVKGKELKKELKSYFKYLEYEDNGIGVFPFYFENLLKNIKKELERNAKANELLFTKESELRDIHIFNELPVFWETKIKESKYNCKAMLDRVIIDKEAKKISVVDLKTTANISEFSKKSFFDYHYDRQLAYYSIAIMKFFESKFPNNNIEEYKIEHFIVAVSKDNEPESKVLKVSESIVLNAAEQISKLLERVHWHFYNDKWDYSVEQYTEGYEII
jgi:hypothetical protein